MNIAETLSYLTLKDYLIIASSIILFFSIIRIRKLKRAVSQEIKKRLLPQLNLELNLSPDLEKTGLFLENAGLFLIRNIKIDDIDLIIDDYGYKQNFILKFEGIDYIKPKEMVRLKFKVYDKNLDYLDKVTETIIPHLATPVFNLKLVYSNIENMKVNVIFIKRGDKFVSEEILLQSK